MSADELREFLSAGTRTAHLATVRGDGKPHVAPVWFVLDGDDLVFTTGSETVKGRNLQRDTNVCLTVDQPSPAYSFVQITGEASLSEDKDELLRWATMIGGRYMGQEQAESFGARNAVEGELLVRVTPAKIIALAELAD
ncbi:MAG: PPOX class F420-dependent oxidoreductase [Actinomycetota bacterium]|nr:PPOX class F420-dependent oxidoreductase [Actinomycetota bacterium]MDQ3765878.1 PPOX class F420-dependent oxidoreductase [Actinomycetota bacterium]